MQRRWWVLVLMLLAGPLAAAEPVALVTELAGAATMSAKSARSAALELLQDLAPGARVTLQPGARATVVHTAAGVVYELSGPGTYRVQPRGIDAADARTRLARRELPAEIRAYRLDPALATQASVVMRGGDTLRLDGPDGGVLRESELRYRVGDLRDARLEVLDAQGTPVLQLAGVRGTVDLAGRHAWSNGQRYSVRLTGVGSNGRAGAATAHFALIETSDAARVQSLRPDTAAARTDWVVYALALESLGANGTARQIWKTLAESR